ncbi:MAG: class I SAM-dependent methyltransferase [Candidatus Aminicenantes bacterium]|nr:class I SAM-dependent methyltransferase [Candidatus Aminicenantes bacterium]
MMSFDFYGCRRYSCAMDARKFHAHYLLQAEWLAPSRHFLYRKISLASHERILDLGCGSGVITAEVAAICGRPILGVDRDPVMAAFAQAEYPENSFLAADENDLLKQGQHIDLILLSFVLMWQAKPEQFLKKLNGLLSDKGILLFLAEPDYGGRIDFPADLDFLKEIFTGHILGQHGDPYIGRKLKFLLEKSGWQAEVGLASHLHFPVDYDPGRWEEEWRFWQDLAGLPPRTLKKILECENKAFRTRQRLVLFPVFYAIARNP